MKTPNFIIVSETADCVLIQDIGPWDRYPTVTNGAEDVVGELCGMLLGRRLEYIDSDGRRDQIIVTDGKFSGFAPPPMPHH